MLKKLVLLALIAPVLANASWLEERRCGNLYEAGFATGLYLGQCGVSAEAMRQKYEPRLTQALNKHNCAQYNEKKHRQAEPKHRSAESQIFEKSRCAQFLREL